MSFLFQLMLSAVQSQQSTYHLPSTNADAIPENLPVWQNKCLFAPGIALGALKALELRLCQ
jgi:hypothetical protein